MSDGKRIFVTGPSGSGKSTLQNMVIRPASHLVVFDHLGTRRITAGREGLVELDSLEAVKYAIGKGYANGFRIWYRPPREGRLEAMANLARFLFEVQKPIERGKLVPPITFAVDEAKHAFPNQALPKALKHIEDLHTEGRHYRISVVAGTQRPAQVSSELRGNADVRYVFRTNEPLDLDVIGAFAGKAPKAQAALINRVVALPQYHYLRIEGQQITEGQTRA